jgi:Peptidase A4 family
VTAGQTVSCSVQYINNKTAGLLYMLNVTTNQHFSITLEPPTGAAFNGSSMEWIMEAPDGGEPVSSLPKFSPRSTSQAPWGAARTGRRAAIPRTAISRTSSMPARLSRRSRLRLTRRPSRSPANHVLAASWHIFIVSRGIVQGSSASSNSVTALGSRPDHHCAHRCASLPKGWPEIASSAHAAVGMNRSSPSRSTSMSECAPST